MSNTFVVIMAGGSGTRFWPFSRTEKPKQFLDVLGIGQSLLQMTFDRFKEITDAANIYIVTNSKYKSLVTNQLPEMKFEPVPQVQTNVALIASPQTIEKVVLANGDELEDKYFKLYRNLMRLKKADTYSYAQYWQPIDLALQSAKKVYISPDGVFNQISINSLQTNEGQYALDKREYVNIMSLRNLSEISTSANKSQKTAMLIGNPQYGSADIEPLPGTGKEIVAISIAVF